MSGMLTEHDVEQTCLGWLGELGYDIVHGPDISPDRDTDSERATERTAYDTVILSNRFKRAFQKLNPNLGTDAYEHARRKLDHTDFPSLIEENRRLHRLMIDGVDVDITRDDGSIGTDKARLIDFADPTNNDWLVVNQFTVTAHDHKRRPDIVVFINGLPIAVLELKKPGRQKR